MATEVYMPKNGMDMTEGTIIRWLKKEGDPVEKDEPIMEIETDKITMESEAPAAGILLKKLYEDGAVVPVLTTIGYIGEAGEAVPDAPAAPAALAPAPAAAPAAPAPVTPAAPAVKAGDRGIDLKGVAGSGYRGSGGSAEGDAAGPCDGGGSRH